MMNKILAISPYAIKKYKDWLKIYPKLGQRNGIFLADFPRKWITKFNLEQSTIYSDDWDEWDEKKIMEFLVELSRENSFLSLNSPYKANLAWEENFLNLSEDKKRECVPIGERGNEYMLTDFEKFDINTLNVKDTVSKKFNYEDLALLLKNYFINTSKIAFVDRHNYLFTQSGAISNFTKLIRTILEITKNIPLGEIVIYALYDNKNPYMVSERVLSESLEKCFIGYKTPIYGIKYLCCSEAGTGDDLHARYILTNNVVFKLTDSIPGNKNSQSITRIRDAQETERLLCKWIDEEHKLSIINNSTFKNQII